MSFQKFYSSICFHLCLQKWAQLLNGRSTSAVCSAFYIQRQRLTKALRGVFCHYVSTLIKEWQPYIHDYILWYLLWLQGQTNKPCTLAITFFIKPPCSQFPNTCLGFLSLCELTGGEYLVCVWKPVSLSELNEKPKQWIYLGYFQKLLPCHCLAKCSVNSSPHNVQRMSCKLATDAGPLQREIHFLSRNVPGKPWIQSHYLFNLLS